MQAFLQVTAGPDAGGTFDLIDGRTLTIGRGEMSDTKLSDRFVSRRHCSLERRG
jgi:pSer/pThr/pTyr-binding forkhead associated (FHA) protein